MKKGDFMSKKKKTKPKFIDKILSFLLLFITIIFLGAIIYLDMLPALYLIIIVILTLLIILFLIALMLKSRKKKTGAIISFLLMIIMSIVSFFIFRTTGLLNNLNLNYKTYNYSVVVLKDGAYDKIKDLEEEKIGYYKTDGEEEKKSLTKLQKKVSLESQSYADVKELGSELLSGKIEAILIEDSYLQMLKENETSQEATSEPLSTDSSSTTKEININDFSEKTKVIYKFTIVVKTSDISKDLDVTKKPFNIYVSGIDTYGEISSVSRSDVNMIVTVNPATQQILLTSIPRDYYVRLHGTSGYKDKLTHAGLYGTDMSIQTLEDLLDIEVNYYIKVNFTSVIDIVDAIDGVEVYSDYDFTSIDNISYSKGYNKVNGKEALSFARERKAFPDGDRQRVKDQQALLEAIFKKCTKTSVITKYNSLLNSLSNSFTTNMKTDRLKALIKMQIKKKYKWVITSNSLAGLDASNYTYSYSSQKLYVMEADEESVNYASDLIKSVMEGEKLAPTHDGSANEVHDVTDKSSSSTKSTKKKDSPANHSTTTNTEGLKTKIGRSTVTMTENDEYTYHAYTATYNGKDVTNSTTITFSIGGKTFDNYSELSYYLKTKPAGEYNVVYKIKYNGQISTQNQTVIIKANLSNNNNSSSNPENTENDTSTNDSDTNQNPTGNTTNSEIPEEDIP